MSYLVIAAISHDICIEKKLVLIIVCVCVPPALYSIWVHLPTRKKTSSVQNNCVCVWVYFFMNMANE